MDLMVQRIQQPTRRHFKVQNTEKTGKQVQSSSVEAETDKIYYNIIYPSNKIQCDNCKRDISKTTKILCQEGDFCPGCFATLQDFPKYYHVINKLEYPLYELEWTAEQELLLFEGLEKHGFGNWGEIADFIGTNKTRQDVEDHYQTIYLQSNQYLPTAPILSRRDANGRLILINPKDHSAPRKPGRPPSRVNKTAPQSYRERAALTVHQTAKNGSNPAEIVGWMPKRGDFEVEFDNDAELLLAEMEFHDDDTEDEQNMKFKLIEIYNKKLNERIRRKQFVVSRGLLDLKEQIRLDRTRTKEEKEVYNMLKVFSRFNSCDDHEKLVQAVIRERQIRQRIQELKQFKKRGFNNLIEVEQDLQNKKRKEDKIKRKEAELFGNQKNNKTRRMRKDLGPEKSETRVLLLTRQQQELCQKLLLPISHFALIKQTLIRESIRLGAISKNYTAKLFKIDSYIIDSVFDHLANDGDIIKDDSD